MSVRFPSRAPIKPLVRARRGARLLVRTGFSLSREAEEEIFRLAQVLSEGGVDGQGATYFGSTMISVDLEALSRVWRRPMDDEERARLVSTIGGSVRVRVRAMRIARAEAQRRTPWTMFGTMKAETRVREHAGQLQIDIDLEGPVALPSARSKP